MNKYAEMTDIQLEKEIGMVSGKRMDLVFPKSCNIPDALKLIVGDDRYTLHPIHGGAWLVEYRENRYSTEATHTILNNSLPRAICECWLQANSK